MIAMKVVTPAINSVSKFTSVAIIQPNMANKHISSMKCLKIQNLRFSIAAMLHI